MSISKYQRFSLKNHHKELDILLFGTNIPAYWHHRPYCNISDSSSDQTAV